MFIDKNGDFPWPFLKEALIGAVSEFTFQVIDYMILENDYSFKAALNNLDCTNIRAEALKSEFLAYVPFRSYTAIRISKLFLGKYRA